MATLREIEDAIVAADAAGNGADVLALAAERDRLISGSEKQAQNTAATSLTADVAKSAAFAIPKAAVGIAGLPGTMRELSQVGRKKILSYLPDSVGKFDAAVPSLFQLQTAAFPSANQLRAGAEQITGPWYDPQSRAAKMVDTGIQTASMMGRNWITAPKQAAAITAGTTAGTEGAGAATNDNPVMRFFGGLLGGGIPAAANAARSRTGQVVRDAIGQPTAADIAAARAIEAEARARGVPLLGTESLDAGHQLASNVRASPTGNPIMERFLRQRPEQVQQAVEGGLLAQTGPRAIPTVNAARAQEAATKVIANEEAARTAAVSPFYKAAEADVVPSWAMRPVADEIQSLYVRQPVDSKPAKALADIYRQAFPNPVEARTAKVAPKARSVAPVSVDVQQDDVITAIRKLGGINPGDEAVGSIAKGNPFPPDPRFGPVWRKPGYGTSTSNKTQSGHSLDEMALRLYEHGYIPERNPDLVMDAIAETSLGRPQFSAYREAQTVDPLAQAIDKLTTQLASKSARKEAAAAPPEGVMPETNVGVLGNLYKNLGIQRQIPEIGATAKDKFAAYPAGKVQDVLGDVLRQNSPNWRQGNALYERLTRERVEPLQQGPVGVVAGRAGYDPSAPTPIPRVVGVVADANAVRPETIRELYTRLNAQDKQAFSGIVQTHLENRLNAALDKKSVIAGSKFRDAIVGTPKEQANFDEMMRGVAVAQGVDPKAVVSGANRLLEILDRTGRTPGVGSQTQPRSEMARELGKTRVGDIASVVSASPTRPAVERWDNFIIRRRYEGLAKALTDPNSVDTLVKLAKLQPNGLTARYYAAALLGLDEVTAAQ